MDLKLKCGSARADITPTDDLLDGLYGLAGVLYKGVIDHLFLRVLALSDGERDALIISFDLDKGPNPVKWIPEISARTGIPEEYITYFGTHTHSAPLTTFRPRESHASHVDDDMKKAMGRYEDMVHERLLEKVDEATASMRPARVGFAKGESFINVNRIAEFDYEAEDDELFRFFSQGPNSKAPVDRTVFVMKIEDENSRPIAFFVNYTMHCVAMFLNNFDGNGHMGISGDIAGNVSRFIEEKFPGSVALWSSGAAGDVNPIIANEVFYPSPVDGKRETYLLPDSAVARGLMLSLASRHFQDILRTVRSIDNTTEDVKIAGAIEWSETATYEITSPERGVYEISGENGDPYRIRLHLLRIGEVGLMGVGGEMFSSLGKLVIDTSPLANTVVINHEASLIEDAGYILDDPTLEKVRKPGPVSGFIPGRNSASKTGTVAGSLKSHTLSLFRKVLV